LCFIFSAISVAAAHGQRNVLHKLLSQPFNQHAAKEVLSLEEILAEGAQAPMIMNRGCSKGNSSGNNSTNSSMNNGKPEDGKHLTKTQVKVLQEAMYQSSENSHLEITLDLRNLGVPWTLHSWMNALGTAYDVRCEPVVDQLLQDFLQILPNEDFSQGNFLEECLPLLFSIFRNCKVKIQNIFLAIL